jgi:hypothetical protein
MLTGLQEEFLEFALEVGRKDVLANGRTDLIERPKAATVEFFGRRTHRTVVDSTVDIDELPFSTSLEDILPYPFRHEVSDTKFLAYFSY